VTNGVNAEPTAQRECILCGKCLQVCPVFAATGREELSPRGKSLLISLARDPSRSGTKGHPDLGSWAAARKLLGQCAGCGRCIAVCPQARDLPAGLQAIKAEHPGWQAWVWQQWISHARHLWPVMGSCSKFIPAAWSSTPQVADLRVLGRKSEGPALFAPALFAPAKAMAPGSLLADPPLSGPVVLFPGCMARHAKPWWKHAAQWMLERQREDILPQPDWGCCGFTLAQAGLRKARAEMVGANIAAWRSLGRPTVVTMCATCTAGLRGYLNFPEVFADDAERSRWDQAIRPLSTMISPAGFTRLGQEPVLYHRPCHAPCPDPDEALLRDLLGSALRCSPDGACCGMGGVMHLSAPRLSARVAQYYWAHSPAGIQKRPSSPEPPIQRVVSGCSACVQQLSATAPAGVQVGHWLELFAENGNYSAAPEKDLDSGTRRLSPV